MGVFLLTRQFSKIVEHYRYISLCTKYCKQNEIEPDFTPVYKFPYVRHFALLNRLKLYQTALTIVGIPGATILNQLNYISNDTMLFTFSLGITGCLTLYSLGYLTYKFVGFIYYNEKLDKVKISYIDFWGNRKDIEIPTHDLVPLNDLPVRPLDGLYFSLKRFSTDDTLKFNLRFGIVLDKEKIKKVL